MAFFSFFLLLGLILSLFIAFSQFATVPLTTLFELATEPK